MDSERFLAFSVNGVLPEESRLIVDRELRVLSLLHDEGEAGTTIIEQQQVTDNELYMILELLASHPYHSPLENLLSIHSGKPLEKSRALLNRAREQGEMQTVIRPVRNVLSRCRLKLYHFGIDIKSIIDTGYQLWPDEATRRARTREHAKPW